MIRTPLFWVCLLSIAASVLWTIASGQDLNFDLITYHFYLGYSALVPRLQLDFLPAGAYGYQSPLPFMLLYWLDSVGMPAAGIATIYATWHAVNLVFLYLLVQLLIGEPATTIHRAKAAAFWILGAIAPVYWTLVGTSFADLSTSVAVLAALWLVARTNLVRGEIAPRIIGWIAAGGAVIGAAAAARPHNGIYIVGLCVGIAFADFPDGKTRLKAVMAFTGAASVGWLVFFMPWAYQLYSEFGNPVFPLFNEIFRSPDFPPNNVPLLSFTPARLWDAITFPLWMATDSPWTYIELPLPDIRPAMLLLIALAAFTISLPHIVDKLRYAKIEPTQLNQHSTSARRVIFVFFSVSTALWLATSSNGRFGVVLFLLLGPIIAILLSRYLPDRHVILAIACVVLWQISLEIIFFPEHRFNSMPWTSRYFDWNLPSKLTNSPVILVSFGFQPASTLAPRVAQNSSHFNLTGFPGPGTTGEGKLQRILPGDRAVYAVFDVTQRNPVDPERVKNYFRSQLALWGLAFRNEPCDLIGLKTPTDQWIAFNKVVHARPRYRPPVFLACELQRSTATNHKQALAELRKFTDKLNPLGKLCPQFFSKPLSYVHAERRWMVTSLASAELVFAFDDEGAIYIQQTRPPHTVLEIGRMSGDTIVTYEPSCEAWFVKLSDIGRKIARGD